MIISKGSILEKHQNRHLNQYIVNSLVEITFRNKYLKVYETSYESCNSYYVGFPRKRDSAIINAIFQINIKSPTQLNELPDLFSCQWNSGTNETYSCTHPLPGAMLWRVKRSKLEFVEITVKVDRQIYWLKLSKCFFVLLYFFLIDAKQINRFQALFCFRYYFVIVFCQLQQRWKLEVWLNQAKGQPGRQAGRLSRHCRLPTAQVQ